MFNNNPGHSDKHNFIARVCGYSIQAIISIELSFNSTIGLICSMYYRAD